MAMLKRIPFYVRCSTTTATTVTARALLRQGFASCPRDFSTVSTQQQPLKSIASTLHQHASPFCLPSSSMSLKQFSSSAGRLSSVDGDAPKPPVVPVVGGIKLAPLEGLPANTFVDCTEEAETIVTTLDNGVRVGSLEMAGAWCAVSVIVGVGARHERLGADGCAHFIDRLAYRSTNQYTHADLIKKLQDLGGNFLCTSNRETIMYQGMVFHEHLEEAMELLSEVALHAKYTDEEVKEHEQVVGWEIAEITERSELFLPELVHRAAYGSSTLGNAHICDPMHARRMTSERLQKFRDDHFVGPRIVISGTGMDHDTLINLSNKYFGTVANVEGPADEPSEYVGGCRLHPMPVSPSNNAQGIPLSQLALGFQGCAWSDNNIYPMAVLQLLMGGGLSFSVGGPGKGMFSRMYNNVMNIHHWAEMALAMNLSYTDSGIFYIHGAAPPQKIQQLLEIFIKEMVKVATTVPDYEVARARNQLKAALLMNLESRAITCEDVGRQVLGFGHRLSPDHLIEKIDQVTAEDVSAVAREMLKSQPTLAAYGNLDGLQDYEVMCEQIKRLI